MQMHAAHGRPFVGAGRKMIRVLLLADAEEFEAVADDDATSAYYVTARRHA